MLTSPSITSNIHSHFGFADWELRQSSAAALATHPQVPVSTSFRMHSDVLTFVRSEDSGTCAAASLRSGSLDLTVRVWLDDGRLEEQDSRVRMPRR